MAQASQLLPTPAGPTKARLSWASIHSPSASFWNRARSRPRGGAKRRRRQLLPGPGARPRRCAPSAPHQIPWPRRSACRVSGRSVGENGTALAAPFQGQTMLLAILVALLAGFHMLLVGATARRFLLVARPGFAARVF